MSSSRLYRYIDFSIKDVQKGETWVSNSLGKDRYFNCDVLKMSFLMPPDSVLVLDDSALSPVDFFDSTPMYSIVILPLQDTSKSPDFATYVNGEFKYEKKSEPTCDCGGKLVGSHVYWCTLVEKGIWKP